MMIAIALLAGLSLTTPARCAPAFDEAKTHYDAGRFEQSSIAFAALAAQNPRNAALQYDLGNALLKSGKLGSAVAAYQRAFDLDPRDADVRANLDFALKRAGEELIAPGVPPLAFFAFTFLSSRELAGLHWVSAWLTLILAGLGFIAAKRSDETSTSLRSAAAFCCSAWIVFGLWWAGLQAVLPVGRGVITTTRAELRNGPGEKFSVGYIAPEGRRVRILSHNGQWLEVGLLKEGVKGWVLASCVERI
ncbi:MAG: tetratricopeptide repeat protein [Elusimicrobiota bacterium]